jgi:hypothetical protein
MKILDRLPFLDKPSLLRFPGGSVDVRAFQIIVWLRIQTAIFPTVLDTGHSHNLSISDRLLKDWAGVDSLPQIGKVNINGQVVPLLSAALWIHKNRAGTREPTRTAYQLSINRGIAVVPEESSAAPRLPLLGLRALTTSGLRLIINGNRRCVTLKTVWF